MPFKTQQQANDYAKNRYHTNPIARQKAIAAASKWISENQEYVNEMQRKNYQAMSKSKKDIRLAKVRKMRKAGLWSH